MEIMASHAGHMPGGEEGLIMISCKEVAKSIRAILASRPAPGTGLAQGKEEEGA